MRRGWLLAICAMPLCAQEPSMPGVPGMQMDMPGMQMQMDPAQRLLMDEASGTSMNPTAAAMPMVMKHAHGWMVMFMGQAFVVDTQQSGARGADKLYSANAGMFMAQHQFGPGTFEFDAMLSLEPATVTNRRYPLLFQTGETAYGKPLMDAQHPHDLFMALGLHYAIPFGDNTVLEFYYAPVGDPALGPVAFPHRTSASEIPEAPLGHHWQDSTHIADNVATVAVKYRIFRLETSGFYGSEPNENRWNIDWGPMNSWSVRASVFPSDRWMAQLSVGRLRDPERQTPGDVLRSTGSVHYSRPIKGASWASSFIWGRNHDVRFQQNTNSYLLESVVPVSKRNFVSARAELVDKNELFVNDPVLEQQLAESVGSTFRIGAYTVGYTRDLGTWEHIQTGLGINATAYTLPNAIKPSYGDHPAGVNIFARFRLK